MASAKRPPTGMPGARRRRTAPTIDLQATEVASEPAAKPAEPAAGPQPAMQAASVPPSEPPHLARDREPPPPPPPSGPGIAWLPPDFPWHAAAAGAGGAAAVLLLFMLIWLVLPRSDATAALTPRLAAIETQLRELAARPAPSPAAVDPAPLNALADRLAKLETALNTPRPAASDPALAQRIAAIEGAIKPLGDSVTALTRRADESDAAFRNIRGRADQAAASLADLQSAARVSSADHSEIEKLSSRIASLEKTDRAVADQLAKSAQAAGTDRAVRLAVAASALRNAIDRGDAFAAELAAVRPLSSDAAALAAVEPFAASGVPGATALGRELILLLPSMQRAIGTAPRDGGFLDRLQANAEKLVRIRPVEEVPGEEPSAIFSRIEVKAAHGDITGVLAELNKLPASARAPALVWIARAEARNNAISAGRRIAADAMAMLKTN